MKRYIATAGPMLKSIIEEMLEVSETLFGQTFVGKLLTSN